MLHAIMRSIDCLGLGAFDRLLFRGIFPTAFFAFLCISEYTYSCHNLAHDAITLLARVAKISFSSFKFSKNKKMEILLPAISSSLCPVAALKAYQRCHPNSSAPFFFVDQFGAPLKVSRVRQVLGLIAFNLNIPRGLLTPHSLRIGAATTAAAIGLSVEPIMRMGLWSSAAFRKYIHCQVNAF